MDVQLDSNITGDIQVLPSNAVERSLIPKCLRCGVIIHYEVLISGNLCLDCSRTVAIAAQAVPKRRKATVTTEERQCGNCGNHTSLSIRNRQENFNCNGCGLYHMMKKVNRLINMRRDFIKRRNGKGKIATAQKSKMSPQINDQQETLGMELLNLDSITDNSYVSQFNNMSLNTN